MGMGPLTSSQLKDTRSLVRKLILPRSLSEDVSRSFASLLSYTGSSLHSPVTG